MKRNRKPSKRAHRRGGWPKGRPRPNHKPERHSYLWTFRQSLGWSQERVAEALQVHPQTIGNWEDLGTGIVPDAGRMLQYAQLAKENHLFFSPPRSAR